MSFALSQLCLSSRYIRQHWTSKSLWALPGRSLLAQIDPIRVDFVEFCRFQFHCISVCHYVSLILTFRSRKTSRDWLWDCVWRWEFDNLVLRTRFHHYLFVIRLCHNLILSKLQGMFKVCFVRSRFHHLEIALTVYWISTTFDLESFLLFSKLGSNQWSWKLCITRGSFLCLLYQTWDNWYLCFWS